MHSNLGWIFRLKHSARAFVLLCYSCPMLSYLQLILYLHSNMWSIAENYLFLMNVDVFYLNAVLCIWHETNKMCKCIHSSVINKMQSVYNNVALVVRMNTCYGLLVIKLLKASWWLPSLDWTTGITDHTYWNIVWGGAEQAVRVVSPFVLNSGSVFSVEKQKFGNSFNHAHNEILFLNSNAHR